MASAQAAKEEAGHARWGLSLAALRTPIALVTSLAVAFGAFYACCSLLIHASFHSNGWDLGILAQVMWNTAHGDLFQYSFRSMNYAGDHWQPLLLALVPLQLLAGGPESLLVFQAAVLAAAAIPLFLAVRRMAGQTAGLAMVSAYLLSLGVARAVAFDFHLEVVAPLLAFTALWAMAAQRPIPFITSAVVILAAKEDGPLLVLGLCWVAWIAFGWRKVPAGVAGLAILYGVIITMFVMPPLRGGATNPMSERYGYLGESLPEMAVTSITHPGLIFDQLVRSDAIEAVLLVLAGAAFLPLAAPKLWPAFLLVTLPPLLSTHAPQGALELHYMLVPAVVALVMAAVALRDRPWPAPPRTRLVTLPAAALVALPAAVFLWRSPLPPSFAADMDRFHLDEHARAAEAIVDQVPAGVDVSAQSPFVPHLAERSHIYQFPRIISAQWVVLDAKGDVPGNDRAAGFDACQDALQQLGFDRVRMEDGVSLWKRVRPPEPGLVLPESCAPKGA